METQNKSQDVQQGCSSHESLSISMGPNSVLKQQTHESANVFTVQMRIPKLATGSEKILYFTAIISSIASGTILPLMTLIFGNFVTVFTKFATGSMASDVFRANVNHYTLYFIYLFVASTGATYISMLCFSIFATNITSTLRKQFVHVVVHQRIQYHETALTSGAVSMALSSHANVIRSGMAEKLGLSLKCVSTVVTGFAVAFSSQWKITLVTATIVPAVVVAIAATSAMDEKLEHSTNEMKSEAATLAEEVISSVRTARALGATDKLCEKYGTYLQKVATIGWKRAPILGVQYGCYFFALYSGYALAFWYGVRLYANHEVKSSGSIVTTLFSLMIAFNSFAQLAAYLGSSMSIRSAGVAFFDIIDSATETKPSNETEKRKRTMDLDQEKIKRNFDQGITFDHLSFNYPTRPGVKALNNLSLNVPAGKTTALVGASGCGKSTVVALLLRWYDVEATQLLFGDLDSRIVSLQELRSNIGLVQQEPCLFSGTVFENIEYGLAGTTYMELSREEKMGMVVDACKMSNAHDFISRLPQGYDTPVGNRGTLLSGGQKQRIAIARAVVKNPPILILDEATSALDVTSESVVQVALEAASVSRTTIVIAHRLSTIRNSDKIVVIQDGSMIEEETHDSLLARSDGRYKRFWLAQALEKKATLNLARGDELETHLQKSLEVKRTRSRVRHIAKISQAWKPKNGVSVIWRILSEQGRYWGAFAMLTVAATIGGALYPVQAILYARIVTAFELTGHALTSRGDFWGLMWFILAIVVGFAYAGIGGLAKGLGEAMSQSYRFSYFGDILRKPISFFDSVDNSPSILLSRIATEPDAVQSLIAGNLAVLVTVGVSLVSTIVLAIVIGWKLALVVIFGALPFIFAAGLIREKMEASFDAVASKIFADSIGFASECIQAIRTVSALNMEQLIEAQFGQLLQKHCLDARKHAIFAMIWFALSESIDLLAMALAFWYGGRLMSFHEYSTTQFFIILISIVFGSQSAGQYFAASSDISKGISGAMAIFATRQETRSQVFVVKQALPQIEDLDEDVPVIEFRDASFAYPARPSQNVLRDINFKIFPGQFVAFVGPSGSGKSTIVSLLERFYELDAGELFIHGISVKALAEDDVRALFALVSQEAVLYQGSILDNVALGASTSTPIDAHINSITEQAQLSTFISSLPGGLSTAVGNRGTALSGGQKQRIAIARAIARDASILLLDEATSALDSESERLIQDALVGDQREQRKTIVAIAHRLSTIQRADRIFVMDGGAIIEQGRHEELLALKGGYWRMCQLQAGGQA